MSISLPTYTRREIPLLGRGHRVWAIVGTGLRREIRRPGAIFTVGVGTTITTAISILLVLFAPFLLPGQRLDRSYFFSTSSSPAVLLFVTFMAGLVGAGLIADDLDTMALTLYLSRPVSVADYLTAKAAILATLTALIAVLPLFITPLLAALFGLFPWDVALEAMAIGVGLGALLTAFFTSLALLLSSLTRRRAYAGAAVFAIVFGLTVPAQILAGPGSVNNPALLYVSPWEDFLQVARAAYGAPGGALDWAPALAILLGATLLCAAVTWLRMRTFEVVSG